MSVNSYEELLAHVGHSIVCATYGKDKENVSIECEDCQEVLMDFDKDNRRKDFDKVMHYWIKSL